MLVRQKYYLASRPAARLSEDYRVYFNECDAKQRLHSETCIAMCFDACVNLFQLLTEVGNAQDFIETGFTLAM